LRDTLQLNSLMLNRCIPKRLSSRVLSLTMVD